MGLILAIRLLGSSSFADETTHGFLNRTLGDRRYAVFVPQGKPPAQGWPLVLFLHGAGERGTDGRKPTEVGIGPAVQRRAAKFPGIVVFPQADFADGPILETWRADEPGGKLARAVLADVERQWPIDPQRRAITGWSMGAYGALSLAAADPDHFSKVLAVSGGGEPEWGPALRTLPVWLVHGTRDAIVPASESRAMAQAIPEPHEQLTFTEVPDAGHDVWRSVYDNDAVLDWLLSPVAAPPPVKSVSAPEPIKATAGEASAAAPFSPEVIISRAVSLRLGNKALQTIAAGVPQAMNEKGLTGELAPIEDEVEFDGRTFGVRFTQMSYHARLHRAVLQGHGPDRLRMAFALEDFEVVLGEIEIGDRTDQVTAGPVSVIIGHREPVWMNLEVRPVATPEGTLRLSLLRSRFAIADNNWYVKPPEKIDIRGTLFTKEIVTTAIVGGVYQRKGTIEKQILAAVEPMLRQVEERADFSPLSQLVTGLWPLPVYKPRLQMRLEETSTDRDGVSLVFGCAAAGLAPLPAGRRVPRVGASTPPAYAIEQSTGLQAGVAVDVMRHLAALVADTDAATLYAADVPGRPFRELDDAQGMAQALGDEHPESDVSDVRARMILREPFAYVPLPSDEGGKSTVRMAIDVAWLSLTVFGRDASSESADEWRPLATRNLSIRQPIQLTATPHVLGPSELGIAWQNDAEVRVRSESGEADPADELVERFHQGWTRWAAAQQGTAAEVPDVTFGASKLRLDGLEWQGECLTAMFRPAATVLVNDTDRPVDYCIRSDASRWSGRLTLGPHAGHIFRTGSRLQIRDADLWLPEGQPLGSGSYLWSPVPDAEGRHWHRRVGTDGQ